MLDRARVRSFRFLTSALAASALVAPVLVVLAGTTACSASSSGDSSGDGGTSADAALPTAVVEAMKSATTGYATLVRASYVDTLAGMNELKTAIHAFVDAPSKEKLDAARATWVKVRPAYSQTEVFRFYGGPIDADDTGPEGRINGWPLDEAFVDYTKDDPNAGIINRPTEFPDITKELVKEENEKGGEKNLSAGWHAIEFLLWGQDLSATGPGDRPYTDFVDGGTAKNQKRRRDYLAAAVDLMVDDFTPVAAAWDPGVVTSYGATFASKPPKEAFADILKGMGSLAGAELAKERMNNAYETKDQEEEHDCFSDTTTHDLLGNAQGIQNVWLGTYTSLAGAKTTTVGLAEVVKAADPALEAEVTANIAASVAAIQAIPAPFDQAILGDDSAPGRKAIRAAMDALAKETASIVKVAAKLGVVINLE
ncbi:MAG: imelysin family protein [Polyangiaceae bacterium]